MTKIKKLFGYVILATLVTVGSLDAQTCTKPVDPGVPATVAVASMFGAGVTHGGPSVVLAAATLFASLRTFGADYDERAYDNCLAWEAYRAAQAEDQRRAAEIRERADQLIREGVARRAAHRAYIARLQAYLDTAKR